MSARAKNKPFFDFLNSAFSVIAGAISGVTPKLSGWMRVVDVDTIQFALSTTGTVAGTWSVQVATDFRGQDAIALDPKYIQNSSGAITALPVPAGSALGPTVYQFAIPNGSYTHIQITFTPSSGAGNAQADTGLITSVPKDISKIQGGVAIWIVTPATSTHAGQVVVEYAPVFYNREDPLFPSVPQQADGTSDIPPFTAAIDSSNTAVAIAATVSGATALCKRLGALEVASIRAKYTPTGGFGRMVVYLNAKAMG